MFIPKYVPKNELEISTYFSAICCVNGVCTYKEQFIIVVALFIAISYKNEIIYKYFIEKRNYPIYCHNLHTKQLNLYLFFLLNNIK